MRIQKYVGLLNEQNVGAVAVDDAWERIPEGNYLQKKKKKRNGGINALDHAWG